MGTALDEAVGSGDTHAAALENRLSTFRPLFLQALKYVTLT